MSAPIVADRLGRSFVRAAETVHAVRDASFTLSPGTMTVLSGPSGSGKTTLLNLVIGWERPDTGTVAGVPGSNHWSQLAVVPQRLGLITSMTVAENVALPLRVERSDHDVDALMHALGIRHLGDRFPDETSLGEQQRTAVARALVAHPAVLVLDEPTSHQDVDHATQIIEQLVAAAAAGSTVLVATHDRRVSSHADQLLDIVDGRLGRRSRPKAGSQVPA